MHDTNIESTKLALQEMLTYSDEEHGGYYLDAQNDGVIHVNVPTNSHLFIRATTGNVVYHTASFSKKLLMEYKQAISENLLGKSPIHMVAFQTIENKLLIGIEEPSDNNQIEEVRDLLDKLGIPMNAYVIEKRKRFTTMEKNLEKPIIAKKISASYDYQHQVMAGGWLAMGDSLDSTAALSNFTSVTCGCKYDDEYGFVTCGHGRLPDKYIFWASPPPSTGIYPPENLDQYSESWVVPLGRVKITNYSKSPNYLLDVSIIGRDYNTTAMAGHAYSGHSLADFGVEPYVNANGYFTGCANKCVSCSVISDSADVIDMRGNQMNDLFFVNQPGILGTSGGPFYYKHIFNPSEFIVAGMACTTDLETTTGFAKIPNLLNVYDITPFF